MKSFHAAMKVKMVNVTSTGLSIGSTIWKKMRSSPAPSMRAASSSSSGIERAYCRTRKMPNTVASAGTTTPPKLLTRCSCFISRNSGSIATCAGITSAASSTWKIRSLPTKRSLAKA